MSVWKLFNSNNCGDYFLGWHFSPFDSVTDIVAVVLLLLLLLFFFSANKWKKKTVWKCTIFATNKIQAKSRKCFAALSCSTFKIVCVSFVFTIFLAHLKATAAATVQHRAFDMLFYDGCLWRLRLMTKIKSEHLKSSRTNHDVIQSVRHVHSIAPNVVWYIHIHS